MPPAPPPPDHQCPQEPTPPSASSPARPLPLLPFLTPLQPDGLLPNTSPASYAPPHKHLSGFCWFSGPTSWLTLRGFSRSRHAHLPRALCWAQPPRSRFLPPGTHFSNLSLSLFPWLIPSHLEVSAHTERRGRRGLWAVSTWSTVYLPAQRCAHPRRCPAPSAQRPAQRSVGSMTTRRKEEEIGQEGVHLPSSASPRAEELHDP